MPKRLPSLTALRTFEAAARHKSFTKAGEELSVTPAAVGFQIKQLEEELGSPLFIRKHRAVALTHLGHSLSRKLAPVFEAITTSWQSVQTPEFKSPLRITAPDAATLDWLMPTTEAAKRTQPGPEIVWDASRDMRDLDTGNWDVAIRSGREPDERYYCEPLLRLWHTPLMRPELAQNISGANDLTELGLIQTTNQSEDVWRTFFRVMKVPAGPIYATSCRDPRTALGLAENSNYVAISGHFQAEKHLSAGTLVSPIPHALVYSNRLWLICIKGQENDEKFLWLRNILHTSAEKISERVKEFAFFDYDGKPIASLV